MLDPQPPQSGPFCTPLALRPPPDALSSITHMSPSSYASLFTRQFASSFNQSLSLDTSSVTDMRWMFWVRSARALPSDSKLGAFLHVARAAASPRPSGPRVALVAMLPLILGRARQRSTSR